MTTESCVNATVLLSVTLRVRLESAELAHDKGTCSTQRRR